MKAFINRVTAQENSLIKNIKQDGVIDKMLESYIESVIALNLNDNEIQKLLNQQLYEAKSKEESSTDLRVKSYFKRKQDVIKMLPKRIKLSQMYLDQITPAAKFLTEASEEDILKKLHSLSHGVVLFSYNKNRLKELIEKIQSGEITTEEAVLLRTLLEVIAHSITNVSKSTAGKLSMPRYLLREAVYTTIGDFTAQTKIDKVLHILNDTTPFFNPEENE